MKALSKSEKILIGILLAALIGYFYYQYIISPAMNKIQTANTNITNYKTELTELKILATSNIKLEESLKDLKTKQTEYISIIPESERNPQIIRDIKVISDNSKIAITSITFGKGVEYKLAVDPKAPAAQATSVKPMTVPVNMAISGDYNSIMNFIKSLEDSSRITQVDSVNVTSSAAPTASTATTTNLIKTGETNLTVAITASILYVTDGTIVENQYDFNNGSYGKDNLFR